MTGRSQPARLAGVWLLACAATFFGSTAVPAMAQPAGTVPAQHVAKVFTEGLGRAPAAKEWVRWVGFFEREGCNATSLRRLASGVLGGREAARLPYSREDRLATAYRALVNRDLTKRAARRASDSRRTWRRALAEVARLTDDRRVCDPRRPAQGFDDKYGLFERSPGRAGFSGSEEALQRALNRAARRGGGTVWLAQRAVIRIGAGSRREQLRIPAGVTLATVGLPAPTAYQRMARLARVGNSCLAGASCGQPVVVLDGARAIGARGGTLRNVWVDGRGGDRRLRGSAVQMESGTGATVRDARLTGPAQGGGNVLGLHGAENIGGRPCSGARATGNLITAYTTRHRFGRIADGITVACEDARVEGNAVVDATDVGIALFGSSGRTQRSLVLGNTVLSAGNSGYAGLVADPHGVCGDGCADLNPRDFSGSQISDNRIITGPVTTFGLGLAVGIRALFDAPPDGFGISVNGNGTGSASARVSTGIAVSGMYRVRLTTGPSFWRLTDANTCPLAPIGASVLDGLASFEGAPPPYRDARITRCWQDRP